ncbi:hypothetical protein Cgig2_023922 [Carnegiea gigantea]|uniref:Uncharacterized protein n=1 Tax=Carnegiea gigantea TaxID=171969 RepID=A0A9Q1JQC8_9CARY|nr:hypothetical protein Cgig2_023922 [Carnegiea gigantea]
MCEKEGIMTSDSLKIVEICCLVAENMRWDAPWDITKMDHGNETNSSLVAGCGVKMQCFFEMDFVSFAVGGVFMFTCRMLCSRFNWRWDSLQSANKNIQCALLGMPIFEIIIAIFVMVWWPLCLSLFTYVSSVCCFDLNSDNLISSKSFLRWLQVFLPDKDWFCIVAFLFLDAVCLCFAICIDPAFDPCWMLATPSLVGCSTGHGWAPLGAPFPLSATHPHFCFGFIAVSPRLTSMMPGWGLLGDLTVPQLGHFEDKSRMIAT